MNHLKTPTLLLTTLLSLAIFAGCGADEATDHTGENQSANASPNGDTDADGDGSDADGGDVDGGDGDGDFADADGGDGDSSEDGDADPGGSDTGDADADADGDPPIDIEPGQLTAGEWRDLDNWSFWLGLFESSQDGPEGLWAGFEADWDTSARLRLPVQVLDADQPVINAQVTLLNSDDEPVWSTRTDNQGRAELFNGLFASQAAGPFTVVTTLGDLEVEVDDIASIDEDSPLLEVELTDAPLPAHTVDLMFMIDTTGSMGDELSYIQAELEDVIERIETDLGANAELRVSVNFYRDDGDEYVVRSFPFRDGTDAIADLVAQDAAGGGDYPEAVDQAMEDAVFEHQWSFDATARLLFFVLDAPPHNNQDAIQRLESSVSEAAHQGIRIIPLMGSGYDKETEYLMRSYAIATGGTFTFLTDDSGIGNPHAEPTIGQYDVELLNDLMVRLVNEYSVLPQ